RPRAEVPEAQPARHSDRPRPVRRRPIPDLPVEVAAPAIRLALGRESARVHLPRRDLAEAERRPDALRLLAPYPRAITDLAAALLAPVGAPAPRLARIGQSARV